MTDRTEVSLDEQIKFIQDLVNDEIRYGIADTTTQAILASLLELQRIRAAERPEPVDLEYMHRFINCVPFGENCPPEDMARAHAVVTKIFDYADTMLAERDRVVNTHKGLMQRVEAERDAARETFAIASQSADDQMFQKRAAESALEKLKAVAQKMDEIMGPCDHMDHEQNCQSHFVEKDCTAKALRDALAALNAKEDET